LGGKKLIPSRVGGRGGRMMKKLKKMISNTIWIMLLIIIALLMGVLLYINATA